MANTKDYSMREMVLDRCFSTGKEYTREELMEIVNRELAQRDMLPVRSLQQLESLGDEGCRVTLDVMINNELIQELAFYGDHLRVESPQRLRDLMAERAQQQLDDYRQMADFGTHLEKD